jgi:hypothetical protein
MNDICYICTRTYFTLFIIDMIYLLYIPGDCLISVDVTFTIVKVHDYFGLRLNSCKLNQTIDALVFNAFIYEFITYITSPERHAEGRCFTKPISFCYFFQVIEENSTIEKLQIDDVLEVHFIKGLLVFTTMQFIKFLNLYVYICSGRFYSYQ